MTEPILNESEMWLLEFLDRECKGTGTESYVLFPVHQWEEAPDGNKHQQPMMEKFPCHDDLKAMTVELHRLGLLETQIYVDPNPNFSRTRKRMILRITPSGRQHVRRKNARGPMDAVKDWSQRRPLIGWFMVVAVIAGAIVSGLSAIIDLINKVASTLR